MLEANKSRWFEHVFAVYNRNLLRRRFGSLRVSGLERLGEKTGAPTIIYPNHSAWWDGLVAFQISHQTKSDSFIMMEEKQLAKLFVFRNLGAFSVVREKPRESKKSINYAVKLLIEKSNRALWIFPQGEILPYDLRPLKFYGGLAHIIKKVGNCRVFNLAIRYEFLGEFKPQIFVRLVETEFESPLASFDTKTLSKMLADRLTDNLDCLKTDIIDDRLSEYQNII